MSLPDDVEQHFAHAMEQAKEARDSSIREILMRRDTTIKAIIKDRNRRINAIKRKSALRRLRICSPMAILFGIMAWYSFSHAGTSIGVCYSVASLAFLLMLVLGAILDRPRY